MRILFATDLESDDVLALVYLIEYFIRNKIPFKNLMIITSLMNANLKKHIVQKILDYYQITGKIVFSGRNGLEQEYSSEGKGIVDHVDKIEDESEEPMREFVKEEFDLIILVNPFCLHKIYPMNANVRKIYIMGGHRNQLSGTMSGTSSILWSFNWRIDIPSTKEFFNWIAAKKIPTTLYSTHMFTKEFGCYYNMETFPKVMKHILESEKEVMKIMIKTMENWDQHVMKDPRLAEAIGIHAGKQFTPADVVCVVGYFHPEIELKKEPYEVFGTWITSVEAINIPLINEYLLE